MPVPTSELVGLARLSGDFQRNYGKLIGALLYLRSVNAARGRPVLWAGLLFATLSVVMPWIEGRAATWLHHIAGCVWKSG